MRSGHSIPGHEVHEVPRAHGHGLMDQKRDKMGRSPITSGVPAVEDSGSMPGSNGAGSPGMPNGIYAPIDTTGS